MERAGVLLTAARDKNRGGWRHTVEACRRVSKRTVIVSVAVNIHASVDIQARRMNSRVRDGWMLLLSLGNFAGVPARLLSPVN